MGPFLVGVQGETLFIGSLCVCKERRASVYKCILDALTVYSTRPMAVKLFMCRTFNLHMAKHTYMYVYIFCIYRVHFHHYPPGLNFAPPADPSHSQGSQKPDRMQDPNPVGPHWHCFLARPKEPGLPPAD